MKLKKATMYRQQKFISYPGLLELQNTLYSELVQAYENLTIKNRENPNTRTKNIKNFHSLCIIYKEQNNIIDEIKLKELRNYCKRNAIQFYVTDSYKLAIKYNCNGIFLSNKNKKIVKLSTKKNFKKV